MNKDIKENITALRIENEIQCIGQAGSSPWRMALQHPVLCWWCYFGVAASAGLRRLTVVVGTMTSLS